LRVVYLVLSFIVVSILLSALRVSADDNIGLMVVSKNSSLKAAVNSIASQRNWSVLELNTTLEEAGGYQSFAGKIKESINAEYLSKPFTYLLLIGTNRDIPIEDENSTILENYSLGDYQFSSVLDSLFYGDINEDGLVDLGVGRLPFNESYQLNQYYEGIDTLVENPRIGLYFYPIYSEITSSDIFEGECISEDYLADLKESPTKAELRDYYNQSDIFFIFTHGSYNLIQLNYSEYMYSPDFLNSSRKPVMVVFACLTAREFGVDMLKKGAGGVYGHYYESGDYGIDDSFIVKSLLEGETYGQTMKNLLNEVRVMNTALDRIPNSTIGTSAVKELNKTAYSVINMVFYGDPSIRKVPATLPKSLNRSTMTEGEYITIDIPAPEITDVKGDYGLCYGGKNAVETGLISAWVWPEILAGRTWGIIGRYVFHPDFRITNVTNVTKTVGLENTQIINSGIPTISIINSGNESYIVVINSLDNNDIVYQNTTFRFNGNIVCNLKGDYSPCDDVTLSEVVSLINLWADYQASLSEVVELINAWAAG
jgi:hypothetical protein